MKRCNHCKKEFPATVEYFHRQGDHLRGWCKDCCNQRSRDRYAEIYSYQCAQRYARLKMAKLKAKLEVAKHG